VVIGEYGILIRGASGSGKSQLALALIAEARQAGEFARLVGDDRVDVSPAGGRLLARAHPAIAGHVERRGLGMTPIAHEARANLRLVVDCLDGPPARLPEATDMVAEIGGVLLPRLGVDAANPALAARLVLAGLTLLT
jgi:HPr kinase/phosphorylase